MTAVLLNYAHAYPMAPAGGLFLAIAGLSIFLGAPFARARLVLLFGGLGLATVALVLWTGRLSTHLPPPTVFAIGSLVFAVALEAALFPQVTRRLWPIGASAVTQGALALVGAHFLLMVPAFGPLMVVLGLLCMLNAALAMMVKAIPDALTWGIDGLLKFGAGALMLQLNPMFG